MLTLGDVHTAYGESLVLRGVSLTVQEGQVASLLGRNGMGKTTTVRSIMGLTPPSRGSITLDGRELVGRPPHAISRMGVGLVPQSRRVFGSLSVEQNLTVVARGDRGHQLALERVYGLFPELFRLRAKKAGFLSGGEQQMLAIGRALMTQPRILLMDEPTEGLAPVIINRLVAAVRELSAQGVAILLIEQNMSFALKVAQVVYVLTRGEVVYQGSVHEFVHETEIQQRHLGVASGITAADNKTEEKPDAG